jgi:2-methylaconitate cis-trans-isomerase PrpF
MQIKIPASFWRGGTSRAVFFKEEARMKKKKRVERKNRKEQRKIKRRQNQKRTPKPVNKGG